MHHHPTIGMSNGNVALILFAHHFRFRVPCLLECCELIFSAQKFPLHHAPHIGLWWSASCCNLSKAVYRYTIYSVLHNLMKMEIDFIKEG